MRKYIVFVALLLLVLSIGCQGGKKQPEGMPKLTPCTVTITLNGSPLDGAVVSLIPEDKTLSRWAAGGTTNAQGKLVVQTLGEYNGAAAGKYKVTVKKEYNEPAPEGLSYQELQKFKPKPTVYYVHKKFAREATTPLTLEVGDTPTEQTFTVEKP